MFYYPTKEKLQTFQKENETDIKQQYALLKKMPVQFTPTKSVQYGFDAKL